MSETGSDVCSAADPSTVTFNHYDSALMVGRLRVKTEKTVTVYVTSRLWKEALITQPLPYFFYSSPAAAGEQHPSWASSFHLQQISSQGRSLGAAVTALFMSTGLCNPRCDDPRQPPPPHSSSTALPHTPFRVTRRQRQECCNANIPDKLLRETDAFTFQMKLKLKSHGTKTAT